MLAARRVMPSRASWISVSLASAWAAPVVVSPVAQRGDGRLVVGEFLAEPFLLALVFAAGDLLFAQPGPFLSLPVFLLGDLGQVVGGQLELFDAQPVIGVGDHDVHRAAEPGDGLPGLLQPRDGGVQGVGLHRADRVVRLVVVGAQHQLGELADHLAAGRGRAVDRPVRRSPHRGPGLDRVLDPRLHPGQLRLVGDGVIERMPVLVDPGFLQDRGLAGLDQLLETAGLARPAVRGSPRPAAATRPSRR